MICDICGQNYSPDEITDKNICLRCTSALLLSNSIDLGLGGFEEPGGIILPTLDIKPKTICWSCKKEYPNDCYKRLHCKMYNPKALFIHRRK